MKKIAGLLSVILSVFISGCFDTVQEITINNDGSGAFTSTTDMGNMIKMVKMMGSDQTKGIDSLVMDTVFSLAAFKDSVPGLTNGEIKLLENAKFKTAINAAEEKLQVAFSFPFSDVSDVSSINNLLKKTKDKAIGSQLKNMIPGGEGEANPMSDDSAATPDINDYFIFSIANGKISNKIDKEKYKEAVNDKIMKSLQEMSQMGMPMNIKTIINLPRPASKANGKGLALSEDKKKIVIEATIDDFFDNPEKFEYEIDY